MLEEVELRPVQPLQIVEEQPERVLRRGEYAEELPEHRLEAVLRVLRREVWNGRLFSDDELDLGDEADDELAVRPHRLRQGTAPLVHLRIALHEDLTGQSLEGLCQGGVRDVALVLVKLAGREQPPRGHNLLV